MKKRVMTLMAAGVMVMMVGCSDKTSESSYESLCMSQMLSDENFKANPQGEAIAKDICSCSAPSFGKMSKASRAEFMEMAQKGEDGHLSNQEDEQLLSTALAGCAMQAVAHQMQSAGQ
jgi:predicted component of type VI protein secretion system